MMGSRKDHRGQAWSLPSTPPSKPMRFPQAQLGPEHHPTPPLQFSCPVPCRCGLSGSARGCTPGLAVPGEEGLGQSRGPFQGWPHGTVTAAAFQEGNGSAPAVQGMALACRHLPEKTHSWKGAQGWLCSPCSRLGEHAEGALACGGTPLSSTPCKGETLIAHPPQGSRENQGLPPPPQSIFLPCTGKPLHPSTLHL